MAKKTITTVKKAASKSAYSASIKVLGKTFTATGSTVLEAITNLKPTGVARGRAVLTVSNGTKTRDRILGIPQTFRLFSASPLMREIALKQISQICEL